MRCGNKDAGVRFRSGVRSCIAACLIGGSGCASSASVRDDLVVMRVVGRSEDAPSILSINGNARYENQEVVQLQPERHYVVTYKCVGPHVPTPQEYSIYFRTAANYEMICVGGEGRIRRVPESKGISK